MDPADHAVDNMTVFMSSSDRLQTILHKFIEHRTLYYEGRITWVDMCARLYETETELASLVDQVRLDERALIIALDGIEDAVLGTPEVVDDGIVGAAGVSWDV